MYVYIYDYKVNLYVIYGKLWLILKLGLNVWINVF